MGEGEPKGGVGAGDATFIQTDYQPSGNSGGKNAASDIARGSTIGRYVVIDKIGAGGMGEVFMAFDPDLDRKVALKLVKPTGSDTAKADSARVRLVREGQAMAKLSHPNVIPVFDVGTIGRNVYIAMEFVEGQDLRSWLDAEDRDWPAILQHFLAAAAGLQAAHEAGLVHRDFKADNALVGADDRLRVIDFGVAHKATDSVPESSASPAASSSALAAAIGATPNVATKTGALMGTPLYMAPEQFLGDEVDERTDQFNFCASLYEALFRQPPFDGDTITKLMINVTGGELREMPESSDVPGWLRDALKTGLSPERNDRYTTMAELVAAITPPEPRKLAVPLLLAGLFVAFIVVAVLLMSQNKASRADACNGLDEPMQKVWSSERQGKVRAALLGSKLSYADAAWTRVKKAIDGYSAEWIAGRKHACQATAVAKEQTNEMLGRRMACYDQRLRELDAVVTVIASVDATVVEYAAQAASNLSPVAMCANQSRLLALTSENVAPGKARAVNELRDKLATIKALQSAGKYADGVKLAKDVYARAKELAWRRGIARAAFWIGDLESRLGHHVVAEERLFEAVRIASEHDDYATEALAWVDLTHVVAISRERHKVGGRWAKHAAVAIKRGGGDRVLQGRLHFTQGHIESRRLNYARALAEYKTAAALLTRVLGPDHYLVAGAVGAQGSMLKKLGRYAEAAEKQQRAAAATERAMGSKHPHLAIILNNLGNALSRLGKYDAARKAYLQSIDIRMEALGKQHPGVASPLLNLGQLHERLGDNGKAEAFYTRALAIRRKHLPENHPRVANTMLYLAGLRFKQGQVAAEVAHRRQVLAMYTAHYGSDSWRTATVRSGLCEALRRARQLGKAKTQCSAAVAKLRAKKYETYLAVALTNAGRLALDMGVKGDSTAGRQVIVELEFALAIRQKRKQPAQSIAYSQFVLALALWTRPADRPAARKRAQAAVVGMAKLPPGDRFRGREIQRWLNEHPLP